MLSWPRQHAETGTTGFMANPDSNETAGLIFSPSTFRIPRKPVPIQHKFEILDDDIETTAEEWRPFYLRRRTLGLFAFIFCCLIVAIEVLYMVSQKGHGLAATIQSRYYLWKYGPTALIVVIAAFWARTTYQAKMAAPWIEFRKGCIAPELTVLLDYVSLPEPTALVKSFEKRSYVVTAAVLGSLLIKLLLIFSAGLITLDRVDYQYTDIALTVQDAFVNDKGMLNHTGSVPFYVLYGVLSGKLPYPPGTNAKYAHQMFDAPSLPHNSQLEALVEGFVASLDCEDATLTPRNWTVISTYNPSLVKRSLVQELDFTSPTCYIKNVTMIGQSLSSSFVVNTTSVAWSRFRSVKCNGQSGNDANRVLISAGQLNAGPEQIVPAPYLNLTGYPKNATYTTGTASLLVQKSVNFICKPKYDIVPLRITINGTNTASMADVIIKPAFGLPNRTLDSISGWDIADSQFQSFRYIYNLGTELSAISYDGILYMDPQIVVGINLETSSLPSMDDLLTPSVLQTVTTRFYQAYTAQIVHSALMHPKTASVVGTAIADEERLVLRSASARCMEAIFAILVVITICMLIKVPSSFFVHTDPSTPIGIASILSRSHKLVSILQNNSSEGERALKRSLQSRSYKVSTESSLRSAEVSIEATEDDYVRMKFPQSRVAEFRWWQPIPNRLWIQLLALITAVGVIVGLEIVLQLSQRHAGLGDVTKDKYLQYVWTYIPALTMVLISAYFSALDNSIRTIAPYQKLREGCKWAASMPLNLVDRTPLSAIVKEVKIKNYLATLTTLAAILGSFLVILGSGVYTVHKPLSSHDLQLNRDTWFQYTPDSTQRYIGEWTAGLILDANLTYPQWTYEELAFSGFSISPNRTNDTIISQDGPMQIELKIPALRSNYQCRLYTQDQMKVNFTWGHQGGQEPMNNSLIAYIPEELCGYNITPGYYYPVTPFYMSTEPNSYFGMGAMQYTPACSNYTYWWGYISSSGVESISALGCNETIQELLADATFTSPGLHIDQSSPPKVDESTVRPATINMTTMDNMYTEYLPDLYDDDLLDNFFSSMIYGRFGLPLPTLRSRSGAQTVLEAIIHHMRVIKAQQINVLLRAPTSSTNATTFTLPATGLSRDRQILVQSVPSTRAIQAVLAAMLFLAIVSKLLVRTGNILPFSPTSIAAVGSLLADSNLLDLRVFPEGIRGVEEREAAAATKNKSRNKMAGGGPRGHEGLTYRLGWFDPQGYSLGWRARGEGAGRVVFTINAVDRNLERRGEADRSSLTSLSAENGPLLGIGREVTSPPAR